MSVQKIVSSADLRQIIVCVGKAKTKIDAHNLQRLLDWTEQQERSAKIYNSFIEKFNTMYFAKWETFTAKYGENEEPSYKLYSKNLDMEFSLEVKMNYLGLKFSVQEKLNYRTRIFEYLKLDLVSGWDEYLQSYIKYYVDFTMRVFRESDEAQLELFTELSDMFNVDKEMNRTNFHTLKSMYEL